MKILRAALSRARRDGVVERNEAADDEWRGMILLGFYSGQRIGDIACLTWAGVDLQKKAIHLVTGKTNRVVDIPVADPLLKHFATMPTGDDPNQPLFPRAFALYEKSYFNGDLSKKFYQILVSAGLAPKRVAKETGNGKRVQHTQNELGVIKSG